jgi:hypothetical protein
MTVPVLILGGIVGGIALLFHFSADEEEVIRRPRVDTSMSWGAPVGPPAVLQPSGLNPAYRPTPTGSGGLP